MKNLIRNILLLFIMIMPFYGMRLLAQSEEKNWTLKECIDYALEHNIQVQQNILDRSSAKQDLTASKFNALPAVNGSATHIYNFGQTIDPFTNSFANSQVRSNQFSLSSNVTLFNGFQTINNIKRNQAQVEAQDIQIKQIMNDVSLNVTNAFLQILFNREIVKNAQNQLKVTQIQIDRISKQVKAGALPEGNLKEIEAQFATEELQLVNGQNQLKLSKINLAQLLNLDNVNDFNVAEPNLENFQGVSELISPDALYLTAVEVMPEIKGAEYNYFIAEKSEAISRGGYYPTLSLFGSIGSGYSGANREFVGSTPVFGLPTTFETASGEAVLENTFIPIFEDKPFGDQLDENFNKSVGFRLSIPIFNGLSARTNVQKSKINVESAQLNLENAKLQLRQNIETAHAEAVAALKRYKAAEKSISALETSFSYVQERFNVGIINSFDFNNEKNRLNNARSELVQAKYEYIFRTKVLDFYRGQNLSLQ